MKQVYKDGLKKVLKKNNEEEWWQRSRWCARRILSAVCFRESAFSCYKKNESILLPLIGYYYSVFHIGVAILYMEYTTDLSLLRRIGHKRLINLVNEKLIQTNLIEKSFAQCLIDLRKYREYANYTLGGKMISDDEFNFKKVVQGLYDETGKCFDVGLSFIFAILKEIESRLEIASPIATAIGDDIGDEVYSMYLPSSDKKRVIDYLLSKELST